jgi:hypothetical protein
MCCCAAKITQDEAPTRVRNNGRKLDETFLIRTHEPPRAPTPCARGHHATCTTQRHVCAHAES